MILAWMFRKMKFKIVVTNAV